MLIPIDGVNLALRNSSTV